MRNADLPRAGYLTLFAVSLMACGSHDDLSPDGNRESAFSYQATDRVILAAAWDTLFSIGSLNDTIVVQPAQLEAREEQLVMYDFAMHHIASFDHSGRLLWLFGGEGNGPNEFSDVRDIAVDAEGLIYALDIGNGRILVLSSAGQPVGRINIAELEFGRVTEFVPLSDGRFVFITRDPNFPIAIHDPATDSVQRLAMPWEGFADLHPMATQGKVGNEIDGRWVFGFSFGPGWFAFEGDEALPYVGQYVMPVHFPKVEQSGDGGLGSRVRLVGTEFAARDVTISGDNVYMLFRHPADSVSFVDTYDWRTGGYGGSYLLDGSVSRLGVIGEEMFAVFNEPYPKLLSLRAKPEAPN